MSILVFASIYEYNKDSQHPARRLSHAARAISEPLAPKDVAVTIKALKAAAGRD